MAEKTFNPTKEQQRVIDFVDGYALVLAPPGCGKTEVLSARIVKAHRDYGIPYEQMLCLTFTNRAAREMQDRIRENNDEPTAGLYVGNLHRFCIRFLAENDIISLDSSIIDDEDQIELIADLGNMDKNDRWLSYWVNRVIKVANVLHRQVLGFPRELINPGKCCEDRDIRYNGDLARRYIEYKQRNNLIDFDDILHLTYARMINPDYKQLLYSNYRWIQVDEVQDLNPLQLAIINKLTDRDNPTVVFLGDERQSIFSFLGASNTDIDRMKSTMHTYSFDTNYRSPKYLVDFINQYAAQNFDIPLSDMPQASNDTPNDSGLLLLGTNDYYNKEQAAIIAAQTRQLYFSSPNQSSGILTRTNQEVEQISKLLDQHGIKHLKLSKNDMFKMVDFKTVYSHFAVIANEHRTSEWSRILYQTRVIDRMAKARSFLAEIKGLALSVTDFMRTDGQSYISAFVRSFDSQEIVVFDTETTGQDVFGDDVIQIAAIKINARGIVPNSQFNIIIGTDRNIPRTLSNGKDNPMIQVYRDSEKHDISQAMTLFIEYVGDDMVMGHNVMFDINIILNNIRRRTQIPAPGFCATDRCWDTLKLARLLDPSINSHKLETLLRHYSLPGVNSHNAIDDVMATCGLVQLLYRKAKKIVPKQLEALSTKEYHKIALKITARYKAYYDHTLSKLFSPEITQENTFIAELDWVYDNMVMDKYIKPIERIGYLRELFRKVMTRDDEPYFGQQLLNHVYEMRTFNEGDLYLNDVVRENVHIMTIHKAKGLQFDNVLIYGLENIPSRMDRQYDQLDEAARILYVAISRAKHRLFLCYNKECSPFITDELKTMCRTLSHEQIDRILQLEDVFKLSKK